MIGIYILVLPLHYEYDGLHSIHYAPALNKVPLNPNGIYKKLYL